MTTPSAGRPKGLKINDLIGLVVGYGLAATLARSFWSKSRPLSGFPAVVLALEFCWLGLAMSGPIILLLDRRGGSSPRPKRRRPARPGRLISSTEPGEIPVGQGPARPESNPTRTYTRAELAWMLIGGYWIALTTFVVPALSIDTPWALVGLLQVVAALGLWLVGPKPARPGALVESWTHPAAVALLATWPFAWGFLILLGKSL